MDRLSGAKNFKAITNVPAWVDMLTADGVPDSLASLYKIVPVLYRVVQLRCDALSSAPVAIIRGKEDEVEWPYPTPLASLLWKWEASLLLSGAAFGEIITNKSGFRKDLRYRNPFDMSVKYEKGVIDFKQNSSGATWQNNLTDGKFEMVYFAEFDPSQDVLPGVGAGKASNVDVKLLYALSKFPEMYFEGGAMPVTLLGIDSADKGEIDRIQTWFRRSVTTIRNAFRVLGVRAGSITPTTLTPPMKDLAFPELSAIAKDNVALAFGIRKTMLDSEAANYATAQEDRLSFYEDVIKPRAHKFEGVLNEQLLWRDGLRIEFRFNEMDLFQEDENERADLLRKFKQSGLPLELALDLAGYELTDEQSALLASHQAEISERNEQSSDIEELRRWQRMAEKRVKEGKEIRKFESSVIDPTLKAAIEGALEEVKTIDGVKQVFESAIAWRNYP